MLRKLALVGATAGLTAILALASVAYAEPGGGKGRGGGAAASIALDQNDPHLGDIVTFTTSGGSKITVACYQGGVGDMVYTAEQSTGTTFLLGGEDSLWLTNDGEADCYAWLYKRRLSGGVLASIRFTAGGSR